MNPSLNQGTWFYTVFVSPIFCYPFDSCMVFINDTMKRVGCIKKIPCKLLYLQKAAPKLTPEYCLKTQSKFTVLGSPCWKICTKNSFLNPLLYLLQVFFTFPMISSLCMCLSTKTYNSHLTAIEATSEKCYFVISTCQT